MKSFTLILLVVALSTLSLVEPVSVSQAQGNTPKESIPVIVFQAAGPNAASIQSAVDAFRAALGDPNGNAAGPLPSGRREINWDGGGGVDATTAPVTPFNVFLNSRGGQFTTPGSDSRRLLRPAAHRAVWPASLVMRVMLLSLQRSVRCDCLLPLEAISLRLLFSFPVRRGL